MKPCHLTPITSLISTCLNIVSETICYMILLGAEVRLACSSLCHLSFIKLGTVFPLFQSEGTMLDCCDISDMMDSGVVPYSASCHRTHGCMSSGPTDLCTFRFLKQSQTPSSSTVDGSSFSQSLPLPSATWVVWLKHFTQTSACNTST